jgi:hypothetical protein
MLDRLGPKKIVVVSSAPQIRYPDCYGIDMAKLGDFIAFQAAIALLKETGRQSVIDEVYRKCKEQAPPTQGEGDKSRKRDLCTLYSRRNIGKNYTDNQSRRYKSPGGNPLPEYRGTS